MTIDARFAHTNLIAEDWHRLARFYEEILGCTPVPPVRDLSGRWLEASTGIHGARARGVHLRLPGHGDSGPTLEIFQYDHEEKRVPAAANRPGYGHIAFAVEDVNSAREAVISGGGGTLGDTVTVEIPGAGRITFVYATDPEGNVIELQSWDS